jgi:hypothetical protein
MIDYYFSVRGEFYVGRERRDKAIVIFLLIRTYEYDVRLFVENEGYRSTQYFIEDFNSSIL